MAGDVAEGTDAAQPYDARRGAAMERIRKGAPVWDGFELPMRVLGHFEEASQAPERQHARAHRERKYSLCAMRDAATGTSLPRKRSHGLRLDCPGPGTPGRRARATDAGVAFAASPPPRLHLPAAGRREKGHGAPGRALALQPTLRRGLAGGLHIHNAYLHPAQTPLADARQKRSPSAARGLRPPSTRSVVFLYGPPALASRLAWARSASLAPPPPPTPAADTAEPPPPGPRRPRRATRSRLGRARQPRPAPKSLHAPARPAPAPRTKPRPRGPRQLVPPIMAVWPFGRKRRRSRIKADGSEPVAPASTPPDGQQQQQQQQPPPPQTVDAADRSRASATAERDRNRDRAVSRRQSRKKQRRASEGKTNPRQPQPQQQPATPTDPPQHPAAGRRNGDARPSGEHITALPLSEPLSVSPHLRPVTDEHVNSPYDFNLQSGSHTSLPTARERGKLQRPPNLRKRGSANDSAHPRRKASKKRKDDHVREEEIRAMSAPVATYRRPTSLGGEILRRDSKKGRGPLNRHFERPTSNISLPVEESIHSSMSGSSEPRAFIVNAFDLFNPRPTIRCSYTAHVVSTGYTAPGSDHSRSESRKEKRPTLTNQELKASKTIDALADDMDAGDLRELLERDQRRREKRRKADEERIRRRLTRRAEKQKREEAKAAGKENEDPQGAQSVGLGIEATSSTTPHRDDASLKKDSAIMQTPSKEIPPAIQRRSDEGGDPSPMEFATPVETPAETPAVEFAQPVAISQSRTSPPVSPSPRPHHQRGPSNLSHVASLRKESAPQVEPPPPVEQGERRSSAPESGSTTTSRRSAWTSFFRRGGTKRGSADRGRATPSSEVSFSNTSRESMARQPPPAHLHHVHQPASQLRARSGTPVRTQSKFREDLPELPLSPPDSRVQSPEATVPSSGVLASRRGYRTPASINVEVGPGAGANRTRPDSPVSPGARRSGLMSQSLASVDSEGSWLSGKPVKRSSMHPYARTSVGSGSLQKQREEEFAASYEELGMSDEEYFRRQASGHDNRRSNRASSNALAPTSDDEDDAPAFNARPKDNDEEAIVRGDVGRQPTVVHRENRVKSREGLLNDFNALEEGSAPTSPTVSPTDDCASQHSDIIPTTEQPTVQRAQSIDLGKGHARHLSAGSARLLDIPSKRTSLDTKRASNSSQTPTPGPAPTVSEET
ncbi:hypothetical protein BDY21DRAFT_410000 [Lineolata rhizophorae]|uniref:Uncharacterized protein n=1 Tax=Lineolata rhizophorae TaxID=578093 RepID=A0A6A6P5G9_9PEZI|nr:hypothetical protein BDY21DRAFT_410000 [Lineolata rhizophorae]